MIDSSIYLQQQTPDFLGSFQKGMALGDIGRARARQQTYDAAVQKGFTQNPDGSTSFNQNVALGELGKAGLGQEYMDFQGKVLQNQRQQQAYTNEQKLHALEMGKLQADYISRIGDFAKKNPTAWGSIRQSLVSQFGLKDEDVPRDFSQAYVDQHTAMATSTADKINQELSRLRGQQIQADTAKTRAETAQLTRAAQAPNYNLTEGEKKVDQDYAKDYNDFTSGGYQKAINAIDKLQKYRDDIEAEIKSKDTFQAGGGPISGSLPDMFRTQASINRRDQIQSVANQALKATFGGSGITDSERKAMASEFYNDKLDNRYNLDIIDRKIKELKNSLNSQVQKAQYYQQNRTLGGFKYDDSGSEAMSKNVDPQISDYAKKNGLEYSIAEAVLRGRGYGK